MISTSMLIHSLQYHQITGKLKHMLYDVDTVYVNVQNSIV